MYQAYMSLLNLFGLRGWKQQNTKTEEKVAKELSYLPSFRSQDFIVALNWKWLKLCTSILFLAILYFILIYFHLAGK